MRPENRTDAASVVRGYLDAHRNRDLDAIMSLYAPDATFEWKGLRAIRGPEALRSLAEYDFAVHGSLALKNMEVGKDVVRGKLRESSDWFLLMGIGEVSHDVTFAVREGRIRSIVAEPRPEDMRQVTDALRDVTSWATKEHARELAELMPEGELVYDANAAKGWIALLRAWRKSRVPIDDDTLK